ncbi:MAG: 4Fe-4S double cluster binding domain-containing protein [Calditrichaceae bacterium]
MDIFNQLENKLHEHDAQCRMISAKHIPEIKAEIDRLYNDSLIDKELYQNGINNYFDYSIADKNPSIQSLIIIATPSPLINVRFNLNGSYFHSIIPPMYSDRHKVNRRIMDITDQLLKEYGYSTFPVILPKKLIAVKSGLARYGKNNICYVEGMGSFHRLTLFASDLPCTKDSWQDMKMLDHCNHCKACINNCPTGSINQDRFIINAEKCLTHFNEHMGPFPDWIEAEWHNSIIGCMRCQSVCPENKKEVAIPEREVEFTESETRFILNNISFNELPESLQSKLYDLCLDRYYPQVSRNLKILSN